MEVAQLPNPQSPLADTHRTHPRVSWSDFFTQFQSEWKQGEHVTLVGPTGAGKTTLALRILPIRSYVAIFATKPRDDVMNEIVRAGYWKVREWTPEVSNFIVLWPNIDNVKAAANQKRIFADAMARVYRSGGWCVYWDEAFYLANFLKLKHEMEMLWTQGRSLGISIVCGTQRPAFIPLLAYDMATHLFFWRDNDERNLARIGGLGGLASTPIRLAVADLEPHEVLYLNTRTGEMLTTQVEV